jgi:hypothetical protein
MMPTFQIHVTNTDYENSNEIDRPSAEEARAEAIKSALQIGVDEVCCGAALFGAEVRIESGSETLERLVVVIGVSSLR